MPNWNYHIGFSFVIYAILVIALNISMTPAAIGFVILVFASLLPDFDHPSSLIRQIVAMSCAAGLFVVVLKIFVNTEQDLFTGIVISIISGAGSYMGVLKVRLKHRGKKSMHQLWVLVFVTVLSALVFWLINLHPYFAGVVFIGYSSHMLLDWIKKQVK